MLFDFQLLTNIHSPKGFCGSFAVSVLFVKVGVEEGRIIVGHEANLCPIQPHLKQMKDIPSYCTGCVKDPIRILEKRGESKSTWMQSLANHPLTLSIVWASILKRLPSWFTICCSMELL